MRGDELQRRGLMINQLQSQVQQMEHEREAQRSRILDLERTIAK